MSGLLCKDGFIYSIAMESMTKWTRYSSAKCVELCCLTKHI